MKRSKGLIKRGIVLNSLKKFRHIKIVANNDFGKSNHFFQAFIIQRIFLAEQFAKNN